MKNLDLANISDIQVSGLVWTSLTSFPLNCPAQGDAANMREGRKYKLTSLNVKFHLSLAGTQRAISSSAFGDNEPLLNLAVPNEAVRLVIVMDMANGNQSSQMPASAWFAEHVTNEGTNNVDKDYLPFHHRR